MKAVWHAYCIYPNLQDTGVEVLPPLVVDLDGTLTPTDTLLESIVQLLRKAPWMVFLLPFWIFSGRAAFKARIARHVRIAVDILPYQEDLLAYLRMEKGRGRSILLATAAHRSIAEAVAAHLGLFDRVLASNDRVNLKGKTKLAEIKATVSGGFVYAGDNRADLPVWREAQGAVLVGPVDRLKEMIGPDTPIEAEFPNPAPTGREWFRALRLHQWLKNLLLFVPLLTTFSFNDATKLEAITLAFLAFSLTASANYLMNDLWDLENDRSHPRKRNRPCASGRITIPACSMVAGAALLGGFSIAHQISNAFTLILFAYLALTSYYSLVLKTYVLIDVISLALLYTLRIMAGAIAIRVELSSWLLAFSVFIFLSLALIKRCSELVSIAELGTTSARGRDYQVSDLAVLWPLGVGSALSSIVIFGLFISTPENRIHYATPELLWLAAMTLTYWLGRLWIKTSRGEMHDDPIIYAFRDKGSLIVLGVMIGIVLIAHFLPLGLPIRNI